MPSFRIALLVPLTAAMICASSPGFAQRGGGSSGSSGAGASSGITIGSSSGPVAPPEITVQGNSPLQSMVTPQDSRILASQAASFVRCAKLPDNAQMLSDILDHSPRELVAQRALHEFILSHAGCYQDMSMSPASPQSPQLGECNNIVTGLCRVTYDRGALYETALDKFAPDYQLGQLQTFDPAIRARFIARQKERNRIRLSVDRDYFMVVACMVQLRPREALDMLQAKQGSPEERTMRSEMIGRRSPCVGGARNVNFDPGQFRAYTAEAVYEWISAARNTNTLVS